ncbi:MULTISPECIES: hypothetical protein [unclassified Methylobacterium]|jgi:hypothetical protein|uniref:hypothetical protein n=1 Tax=unclassified Methylobacterium TaxID=2615210 RepID=UPI001A9723A2|nr:MULTISPECIES: hypothetical protein [unclassified Methylobacterium]MBO1021102.1 hypothetical protein [Methylobacterium sp. SD274]
MAKRFGLSAALGVALIVGATSIPASAMPGTEGASSTSVQRDAEVGKVALTVEAEDDALACTKSRKRLFVDGEGWIVRRVTTCR